MVEGHISEWCVLWYLCFMTISIFLKIGRVCFQKLLYMALEIIVSCKTAKLLFGFDLCLFACGVYNNIYIRDGWILCVGYKLVYIACCFIQHSVDFYSLGVTILYSGLILYLKNSHSEINFGLIR